MSITVMYHPSPAVYICDASAKHDYPTVTVGDVTIFPASAEQARKIAAVFIAEAERVEQLLQQPIGRYSPTPAV